MLAGNPSGPEVAGLKYPAPPTDFAGSCRQYSSGDSSVKERRKTCQLQLVRTVFATMLSDADGITSPPSETLAVVASSRSNGCARWFEPNRPVISSDLADSVTFLLSNAARFYIQGCTPLRLSASGHKTPRSRASARGNGSAEAMNRHLSSRALLSMPEASGRRHRDVPRQLAA